MDTISMPKRTGVGNGTLPYFSQEWFGPFPEPLASQKTTASMELPLFGAAPRPVDAQARKWWEACFQFLRRAADTWQPSTGAPMQSGTSEVERPVLVTGIAGDAVVPLSTVTPGESILEDAQVALVAGILYAGAYAYADRFQKLQVTGQGTPEGEAEIQAASIVSQLANEYELAMRKGTYVAAGIFGAGLLGAFWAGSR
jgi:hypothetical protein